MDRAGHDGPQRVVVPHLDLGGGDGVVLVDDGQSAQLQQALQGVFKVLPPLGVVHILAGEEDLSHRMVILEEQPVIGVHQLTLAHRGGGLLGWHITGLSGQIQLAHAHTDGAG